MLQSAVFSGRKPFFRPAERALLLLLRLIKHINKLCYYKQVFVNILVKYKQNLLRPTLKSPLFQAGPAYVHFIRRTVINAWLRPGMLAAGIAVPSHSICFYFYRESAA
jgi:hypothetical protein